MGADEIYCSAGGTANRLDDRGGVLASTRPVGRGSIGQPERNPMLAADFGTGQVLYVCGGTSVGSLTR